MLGKDLEVLIPNLELVRGMERQMDAFRKKRGDFLRKHASTRKYLSKLGYADLDKDKEGGPDNQNGKVVNEPDLVQIRRDKLNSETIWNELEMDLLLKQSIPQ